MLTKEEKEHKNEIIELTEQVLDAKGIECDSRIAKISEEQLKEILEEVRQRRKKKKSNSLESDQNIEEGIFVQ
jgi:ribosomal protein S13